ncbi:uncharacterized protein [Rutidosis leptorrhynchoides]
MQKSKKKKVSHHDLNTKSSIFLEWDQKKEQVVSKREQISIARRELTPFIPSVSKYRTVLGDVFEAPSELFELESLTGLISYEVWETHLSLQEREFLTRFLPDGSDPHEVVYELLAGRNLCFGNSFSKWGASVCSGGCHPDAVLRQEERNKANKISFYSELNNYHTKMIGRLQLWKERWASCVDPENDFTQKILSSREVYNKRASLRENYIQYGREEGDATSGSCSWDAAADEKLCSSSDTPDLAITNGEALTRVSRVVTGNKYYDSASGRSVARPKKGDKSRRINVECDDGAKYMSYIKVSKEQHERVKSSMRNSNTSIQPKSLDHVLGNLDGFCVQPYEVFEEEERQKLHDHWSHLAKKDLHIGFENWKSWRSAKSQVIKSLIKELEDKWKLNNQPDSNSNNQYEEKSGSIFLELNDNSVIGSEEDLIAENHETSMQIEQLNEPNQDTVQNQHVILNDSRNFCSMAMDDANNEVLTESSQLWPAVSLPPSVYYNQPTSVRHEYASIGDVSISQAQSSFLHRRSDGGDSFYNPFANQDRNELLMNQVLKDPVSASYLHEQKISRLAFLPHGNDALMGPVQFPRNLCSSLPLVPSSRSFDENMFRQEHLLPPLNPVPDWVVNGVNMPMMSASSSHNNFLNRNWVCNNEMVCDGWSGGVAPHQDIVNIGQVANERLYGSGAQFGSTSSVMEQFVQPGNYVRMGRGPGPFSSMTTNVVPPGHTYMHGNEGHLGWMNLQETTRVKSLPRLWIDKDLGR